MFFAACEADLSRHGQLLVDEDDDIDHKEFRLVSVQHDQLAWCHPVGNIADAWLNAYLSAYIAVFRRLTYIIAWDTSLLIFVKKEITYIQTTALLACRLIIGKRLMNPKIKSKNA